MSAKIVTDVINNCGVNFNPTDCATDVDGKCILDITLNCFKQMIDNVGVNAVDAIVQTGGGQVLNTKSIVPYMEAYNIKKLTKNTLMPRGILATVTGEKVSNETSYWQHVSAGTMLSSQAIKSING